MTDIRHLVVGLQESGKTTFIAALWYLVEMGEFPTELTKGPHVGDHVYLNEIAQSWERCEPLLHTKFGRFQIVRMNLIRGGSDTSIAIEFPDLSGEAYERMFSDRVCQRTLVDAIDPKGGILLFVSARRKIDDVTILDFERARLAATGAHISRTETNIPKPGEPNSGSMEEDPPWDATHTPHQVQIVDVLQLLSAAPFPERHLKIAVIISAWDLEKKRTPKQWLSDVMPMLSQYLHTNSDRIEFRVYGVSAQGGKLKKPGEDGEHQENADDRQKLLEYAKPSERIQIVGHDAKPHDITAPIAWLSERS